MLEHHARRWRGLARLPPRVAWFHIRARRTARRAGDGFSLTSASPPGDVAQILALARGCCEVVEIGTGTAWTALSLALADPARRVMSFDPVVHEHRQRYVDLVPDSVRERVELVRGFADPRLRGPGAPVEFLFLDSSHDRDETIAAFRLWEPQVAPSGTVVLHDYDHPEYPGVAQAVAALGLRGRSAGPLYVWRKGG